MGLQPEPQAVGLPSLGLTIPDAPEAGFTVAGSGFPPDAWIWITVDDTTDGSQPVNGPDAFQPDAGGSFTRTDPTLLACAHTFVANAFVQDAVAASSDPVTPRCPPPGPPVPAGTADTDATAATRSVLADLVAAPGRLDHRLVIGQALRSWDFNRPLAQPVTALTDAGLPAPKLVEVDLTSFGVTPDHDEQLRTLLVGHAARGGLIGFSFHVDNPFTGGNVWDTAGVHLAQIADPDHPQTPAGVVWKGKLDQVADTIVSLADPSAVILFRPLHESNGQWFWWGQADPAGFRATWQGMFRYLTVTRGLHNLLWVYSAAANLSGALSDPTRLYPGGDLVDLVGLDIYDDDLSDAQPGEPGYAAMVALGKPFGITEYGAANDPPHDGAVHLPNDKVMGLIRLRYPETVLAAAWYSQDGNNWQISDKPNPQALLLDPWATTL